MNEEMVQQMMAAAERLAAATETLDRVLGKLDAQQEMLNAKVDRIVAAVEESVTHTSERQAVDGVAGELQERVVQLEKIECGSEGAGFTDGAEDAVAGGVGADRKERDRRRAAGSGGCSTRRWRR